MFPAISYFSISDTQKTVLNIRNFSICTGTTGSSYVLGWAAAEKGGVLQRVLPGRGCVCIGTEGCVEPQQPVIHICMICFEFPRLFLLLLRCVYDKKTSASVLWLTIQTQHTKRCACTDRDAGGPAPRSFLRWCCGLFFPVMPPTESCNRRGGLRGGGSAP